MSKPGIPEFTVLSDHFDLQEGSVAEQDLFALDGRLRPVFDIVRHKDTAAPLALALYGGAGTGKTTALRWLMEQLDAWNAMPSEERAGHPRVLPVWFRATDVPVDESATRRLVADILLHCLENLPDDSRRSDFFQEAAEQCSGALGMEFYGRLSRLGRRWGLDEALIKSVCCPDCVLAEWDTSYGACLEFIGDWQAAWARTGAPVRLVPLIDDLDHCRAERMMELLDAVAARLKSTALIFVLGLDQVVAHNLVARHYKAHGYGEEQIRRYLGKVFQGECQIEPTARQVDDFYVEQFNSLNLKMNGLLKTHLPQPSKSYIDTAMMKLSNGNPRKIKMLLNSAMMKAFAAFCQENAETRVSIVRFLQRVQIYLLQRWLTHFTAGASVMHRKDVQEWFSRLSEAARKPEADYEKSIVLPQEQDAAGDTFRRVPARGGRHFEKEPDLTPPDGLSYAMIQPWVWDLLKIPFDANMTCLKHDLAETVDVIRAERGTSSEASAASKLISEASDELRTAMAAALEKEVDDLTDEDIPVVMNLDFSGRKVPESDYPLIGRMGALTRLNLTCSEITDLSSLAGLKNLQQLDLSYTGVTDLSPLEHLEQLETLILYGGAVKSLEGIRGLQRLQKLNLSHTELGDQDLDVIESLPALNHLFLRGTSISGKRAGDLARATHYAVRVEL